MLFLSLTKIHFYQLLKLQKHRLQDIEKRRKLRKLGLDIPDLTSKTLTNSDGFNVNHILSVLRHQLNSTTIASDVADKIHRDMALFFQNGLQKTYEPMDPPRNGVHLSHPRGPSPPL